MAIPRRIVRDYMFASRILMKTNDLTNAEIKAMREMLEQLTRKFAPGDDYKS